MEIKSGSNKGYFVLPLQFVNDGSIVRKDEVYSRFQLPNGKRIHGFNSSYLPYLDGYYYIPKNTQIDIRKLAYALENKLIPSSGNTEKFNTNFEKIVVPDNYCPHYLEPCFDEWCERCKILKIKQNLSNVKNPELSDEQISRRNNIVWVFSLFLAAILLLAILS